MIDRNLHKINKNYVIFHYDINLNLTEQYQYFKKIYYLPSIRFFYSDTTIKI